MSDDQIKVYTLGFAGRSAAQFFGILRQAGVKRVVDVRLNNVSQLAGFTKREDLRFFLRELCRAEYRHELLLAPTKDILDDYRQSHSWDDYTGRFLTLLAERRVEEQVSRDVFDVPTALLCSEPTAEKCHRRLVLDYLREKWGGIEPVHL
jgi:uncharacterized protein (DUF488 family)